MFQTVVRRRSDREAFASTAPRIRRILRGEASYVFRFLSGSIEALVARPESTRGLIA